MATQVILLERVDSLGGMGDVVSVKPGYARNFLLPQKKALRASKENIAYFDAKKKHLESENEKSKKEAEKLAKSIAGIKVPIIRQASESGQLYGSVTAKDIAEQAAIESKEAITRTMVKLNQNFKSIGLFPVDVALHPEVKAEIIINIARSIEESEIQTKTGKALVSDAHDSTEEIETAQTAPEDETLQEVLEDSALEAEKEKQEDAKTKEAEDEVKAEKSAEKKAAKDAKKAAEAEKADAESETETPESETSEEVPSEEKLSEE